MTKMKDGCVKPTRGPIPAAAEGAFPASPVGQAGAGALLARVGKEAPDFEVSGFVRGAGFQPVKLSDHRGKWIVLCFYPGDFTFV